MCSLDVIFQVQHSYFYLEIFILILLSCDVIVLVLSTLTGKSSEPPRPPPRASHHPHERPFLSLSPSSTPNLSCTVRVLHMDKWAGVGGSTMPRVVVSSNHPRSVDHFLWLYQTVQRTLRANADPGIQHCQAVSLQEGRTFSALGSYINQIRCSTLPSIANL